MDISIINNKKPHKGNSFLSSYNRKKRLKCQEEYLIFVGNRKHLWHGSFNEGFVYARAKKKPYKSTYEIQDYRIIEGIK